MKKLTPISKAIKQFENLKKKAISFKDVIYLDGVLAVLDTLKDYEKDLIEQTHIAGQKDAGVDPNYNKAVSYFNDNLK